MSEAAPSFIIASKLCNANAIKKQKLITETHSAKATLSATREALSSGTALSRGLTAEELSRRAGVSVVLTRERLLAAEAACRDDSVEKTRFYHNRILLEV